MGKGIHNFTTGLIVLSFLLLAATTPALGLRVESADLRSFPQVSVRLSAWDAEGLPLRDLEANDFSIRENQGSPFAADALTVDKNAPLAVVLVLDVSGSMQGQPLVDAKVAAARFLDRLSAGNQAALIAFSDNLNPDPQVLDPTRELGFRGNMEALYDMIEGLQAAGGTHIYNALSKATTLTQSLPSGHRAILLLSDGTNEPADVGNPDEAITLAKQANLPIYVIGLGNRIDEQYLRRLTAETGGVLRLAPSSAELAQTFDDMAELLKTQYVLKYTSQISTGADAANLEITLDKMGMKAVGQTELINVPALPTATPMPSATALPTATQVPVVLAAVEPVETPSSQPEPESSRVTLAGWSLVLLGLLSFVIVITVLGRKRKKEVPMQCAKCGYKLLVGALSCPQCGETRQIETTKK